MSATRSTLDLEQFIEVCKNDRRTTSELLACEDYRQLLDMIFSAKKELNPKFSYTLFARRAGFAARGFVKDVIAGKKRVTYRSLPKIVKGFDLGPKLEELLRVMVALEETDVPFNHLPQVKLSGLLKKYRQKIKSAVASEQGREPIPSIFRNHDAPRVYAALGEIDKGSTIQDIKRRTSFQIGEIKAALQHLIAIGIVEQSQPERFHATNYDINVQEKEAKSAFRQYYVATMKKKTRDLEFSSFDAQDKLFWLSHISVQAKDLPKLKQDLRELLARYVERMEDATGDRIVDICVSLD